MFSTLSLMYKAWCRISMVVDPSVLSKAVAAVAIGMSSKVSRSLENDDTLVT